MIMIPRSSIAPADPNLPSCVAASVDLRADRRFSVDLGGVLQVKGSGIAIYVVTVRDISKSGLRVSCPASLPDGTRVEVACCDTIIAGEVRYSREVFADDFYIGIKADQGGIDLRAFLKPIARCV